MNLVTFPMLASGTSSVPRYNMFISLLRIIVVPCFGCSYMYLHFLLLCSPHQQKMFKVGASVIIICLVLLNLGCCYRQKLKTCCSKCLGRKEVGETQDNDAMNNKKEEDGGTDNPDANGSNRTDSDKMVDEEDEV